MFAFEFAFESFGNSRMLILLYPSFGYSQSTYLAMGQSMVIVT